MILSGLAPYWCCPSETDWEEQTRASDNQQPPGLAERTMGESLAETEDTSVTPRWKV